MPDLKYKRIFTESDVHKIVEVALESALIDQIDAVIDQIGDELTFRPDEPVFVLRGQDAAAYGTVDEYRFAITAGPPDFNGKTHAPASSDVIKQVDDAVTAFANYASENPDVMKVVD